MTQILDREPSRWTERVVVRQRIATTTAVARTNRLDGRTRVIAVRLRTGWRPARATRLTEESVDELRSAGAIDVLVRRGLRYGRMPLAWLLRTGAPHPGTCSSGDALPMRLHASGRR